MTYAQRLILLGLVLWLGGLVFWGVPGRLEGMPSGGGSLFEPAHHGVPRSAELPPVRSGPHPLEPALELARRCLQNIQDNVRDYSATVVKREQVDGQLADVEEMFIQVRNRPFSVHMYFEVPESLKGQEVVYVQGQNGGNLIALPAGLKRLLGTLSLPPDGFLAMHGQRYPITEIGILNLTRRLIEVAEQDLKFDECQVTCSKDVQVAGRPCTCIEVVHPQPRAVFRFYKALVCIDQERDIPLRYEAYDWPAAPGGEPPLLEQYIYKDVQLNIGLTDADFELR